MQQLAKKGMLPVSSGGDGSAAFNSQISVSLHAHFARRLGRN
jgi:hypothetical protein